MSDTSLLYGLPRIYDVLHAPGTIAEVNGLERIERRFCRGPARRGGRWLEPACGTGRHLRVAARRGRVVAGFDLEVASVAYLETQLARDARRQHGADAGAALRGRRVFVADMTDFVRGLGGLRAGFAFNLINTIRHLPDDAAMLTHLDQMAAVLISGGVYVVGLHMAHYENEFPSEDVWEGRRGDMHVKQIAQYEPGDADSRRELVVSHLVVTQRGRGGVEQRADHLDDAYTLRCYSLEQWKELIHRSPFNIVGEVDEDGEDFPAQPGRYAYFVMSKK